MNKKLVASTVLAALALTGGTLVAVRRGQAASVEVAPGPIEETVIAQGQVVATAGTAEVRALVDGRVVEVLVREGDIVGPGSLLARLDTKEADAAIARAEAEREVAEAELQLARTGSRREDRAAAEAALDAARAAMAREDARAARDTDLADKGAVSEELADQSRRNAEVARAGFARAKAERTSTLRGRPEQVEAARAKLAATEAALAAATARRERSVITSPIVGVVLARNIDAGDNVVPGASMFELADPRATELLVEIEDTDAMRVAPGLAVTITSLGGAHEVGRGKIDRVSPRLNRRTIGSSDARMRAETQVRSAWVRWDSATVQPIGLRVEAHIKLPTKQVDTRVPRSAVEIRDGRARVEVPHYGLLPDERTVELGIADAQWVEVKGVRGGTRVAGVAP
ncbi:MAG TPA: HlyD family efflux transporter periplasmic adaptor subunit [Kofleriaceae bacterium]